MALQAARLTWDNRKREKWSARDIIWQGVLELGRERLQ